MSIVEIQGWIPQSASVGLGAELVMGEGTKVALWISNPDASKSQSGPWCSSGQPQDDAKLHLTACDLKEAFQQPGMAKE